MWLPLALRMPWVVRCHADGGVVAGGSRCSALFGGAGVAGARAVPHCSAAQRLRALGWFADAGWQDSRVVHDSRGPCSEKCPFLAGSSRGVSSDGDLRGISDAWRAYLAKASPLSDAWRANLAANWRFFRPRPLSGCVGRKNCHGLPPGNASRHNLATTGRPRRTPRATMCYGSRLAHGRGSERPPFAYATRHPDAAGLRVLQAVRALAVAQPADCRVAAERVVNIAKLVSVPQRRSATTPCATMSCAAAPQRHALQHRVAMHHDAMRRTRRFCRR